MDFKLIWSESSIEDLAGIIRFLAVRDGPEVARQIGFAIYDRVQVLKRYPEAGSILEEKQDTTWRKLLFKSWKIAYRIEPEQRVVYLIRIWHAARGQVEIP